MLPWAEARRLLWLGFHQQVPTEQQLNSYNNWKDNLYICKVANYLEHNNL